MTNSNILTDKSSEEKTSNKELVDLKETLVRESTRKKRYKRKNNNKKELEKNVCVPQITPKVNVNIKNKVIDKNRCNVKGNQKKCLDGDFDSQASNDKEKILSPAENSCKTICPNHKLTEYFSHLNVDNQFKSNINKETNLKKNSESDVNVNKNVLSCKSKQNSNILQKPKKKYDQCRVKSNDEINNHKVTEYFQIRRSQRNCEKNIISIKQRELEQNIVNESQDGLKIEEFEGKGRGVVTTKEFHKGDFVVEYIGDLIDGNTAKQREIKYAKNKNIGSYMYYFKHKNKQYCIDATEESDKLGRLINHSRKGNLVSKIIEINKTPRLVLFAKTDIPIGIEVLYDYGDRSQESVRNHPWLSL